MELADWYTWWKHSGTRELREILMSEWDPIGVADISEAQDEYDTYVGQIAERLRKGESGDEIGEYLIWAEGRMGLSATDAARERDRELGARLVSWHSDATA